MSLARKFGFAIVTLALLAASTSPAKAQTYPRRPVLRRVVRSADFERIVEQIVDPRTRPIGDVQLKRSDVYFRLTQKAYVLTDGLMPVEPTSVIGGTPYCFLTVPQAGFGRSLYDLYADLGYTAEDVLNQRNVKMVALVFRYPDRVQYSRVRNGDGPLRRDDFKNYVYTPTWANGMQLFAKLAPEKPTNKKNANDRYLYLGLSQSQQRLAMYFQQQRRDRIASLPYVLLRMEGGPDWQYRQLLESKMSMNSRFRGVGRTENTLNPASDRAGLPEFVGPNMMLQDLKEYAVIDMGQLKFVESHDD